MTLKESRNAGRKQQTAHNVVPITSVLESLRQENTKLHILGDLPGHVRAGAVDLRRILPGERPTAVTAHAAVGVADDFSAGDAGVGEAATGYKSAGWVYQHTEIFIQAVRFRDLTHDPLTQITHVFGIDVLLMLCADQKGVDALFPVVIGDLGFRVRQQSRMCANGRFYACAVSFSDCFTITWFFGISGSESLRSLMLSAFPG